MATEPQNYGDLRTIENRKQTNIKGLETPERRIRVADRVCRMIDDAIRQRPDKTRWEQIERQYRGGATHSTDKRKKGPDHVWPILSPRVDQLAANVHGSLAAQKPYVRAILRGSGTRADSLEGLLQFFLELGDIDQALEKALPISFMLGACPARVRYVERSELANWLNTDTLAGMDAEEQGRIAALMTPDNSIVVEPIHPLYFVILPVTVSHMRDARMVGHKFFRVGMDVQALQESGVYFSDGALMTSNAADEDTRLQYAGQSTDDASEEPLRTVECYELIVRLNLDGTGAKGYRLVVDYKAKLLLDAARYELPMPWYVRFADHQEIGGWWNVMSRGSALRAVQLFANSVVNMYVDGTLTSMRPPVAGSDLNPTESTEWSPGQMVNLPDLIGDAKFMPTRFEPQPVPFLLSQIENKADAISGMSQTGMGQQLKSGATASEAMAIEAGRAVAVNRANANVGYGLEDVARIAMMLLYQNFNDWHPRYQRFFASLRREQLLEPVSWEITGRTASLSPAATVEKLRLFMDMTFNPAVMDLLLKFAASERTQPGEWARLGLPNPSELIRAFIVNLNLNNAEKILPELDPDGRTLEQFVLGGERGRADLSALLPRVAQAMSVFPGDAGQIPANAGNAPAD